MASGAGVSEAAPAPRIADRFRGFLPVVVDVETGGFNAASDALLESVRGFRNVRAVERVAGNVFIVTLEGQSDERAGLLSAVQETGAKVSGFSPVGLPLELMYMDLVKESR